MLANWVAGRRQLVHENTVVKVLFRRSSENQHSTTSGLYYFFSFLFFFSRSRQVNEISTLGAVYSVFHGQTCTRTYTCTIFTTGVHSSAVAHASTDSKYPNILVLVLNNVQRGDRQACHVHSFPFVFISRCSASQLYAVPVLDRRDK